MASMTIEDIERDWKDISNRQWDCHDQRVIVRPFVAMLIEELRQRQKPASFRVVRARPSVVMDDSDW